MSEIVAKLIRLHQVLHQVGFTAGPAQLIESLQLLDALRTQSIDITRAGQMADYLGPIYCVSEAQQRDFPGLLARAWGEPAPRSPPRPREAAADRGRRGLRSRWARWLVPLAAMAGLAGLALAILPQAEPQSYLLAAHVSLGDQPCTSCSVRLQSAAQRALIGQNVTDAAGDVSLPVHARDLPLILTADSPCAGVDPVSTGPIAHLDGRVQVLALKAPCVPRTVKSVGPVQTGSWRHVLTLQPGTHSLIIKRQRRLSALRTLTILSPLLLAAVWWLYWAWQGSAWLQRMPQWTPRNIRELSVGARHSLAGALGWRQIGHELRRREWVASDILDVEATLDSLLASGNPRLVFGMRVEPEYLALIEETSPGDHLARFGEELLLALEHRDVGLRRYYFRDSPARCAGPATPRRPRGAGLAGIALDELLARHLDHRLLIISDGRCLFDRVTGQPHPWTLQLARARQPALLTAMPRATWGRREWALGRLGFAVLPLDSRGVERLSEAYVSDRPPSGHAPPVNPTAPRWMGDPLSMLLPAPPVRLAPSTLREQLEKYLGAAAYHLAQGAAAYPEIHWGLTTRIGARLLSKAELAESLPRLAVLPWFRLGYMPQWFRAELTGAQTRASWERLHNAVTSLLEAARQDARGAVPLRIATDARPYWLQVLSRLFRHRLEQGVHPDPAGSPLLRDTVFLRFLQGPQRLSVRAGGLLRRALLGGAVRTRGAGALSVFVLALLAAGVLGWQRPPYSMIPVPVAGKSQITALAGPLPPQEAMMSGADAPMSLSNEEPMSVLAGYSSGQVWMLGTAGSAPLPIPPLQQGIGRLAERADGSIEVTEVGGRVLDVILPEHGLRFAAPLPVSGVPASQPARLAVHSDRYSLYPVFAGGAGQLRVLIGGPDPDLAPAVSQPRVVDFPGEALCAGRIEQLAEGSPASPRLLVVAHSGHADAGVEVLMFSAALQTSPFMSGPPGVNFDGCRIQERFIVAWRATSQGQEVWRARVEAPREGFTRVRIAADRSKGAIRDALLSDNERSLFLQRVTGVVEVYGPRGLEGHVEAPAGAVFSSSTGGQQLAVASGDTVSLWRFSAGQTLLAVTTSNKGPEYSHWYQQQLLRAGFPDAQVFFTPNRYAVSLGRYSRDEGAQAIASFKALPRVDQNVPNDAQLIQQGANWIGVWPAAELPRDCSECPELAVIPAGSFQMGSAYSEVGRDKDQGPVHTVNIFYPLAVTRYPITRGEWRQYLAETHRSGSSNCFGFNQAKKQGELKQEYSWLNPGFAQEDNHPVVCVTWQEAQDYAAWLSKKTDRHYRLLSEAEYEYVERAGSQSQYPWGSNKDAQCEHTNAGDATLQAALGLPSGIFASCRDGFEFTSPVDHFSANAFGLYDTDGNAQSWIQDCYHESYEEAPADGRAWQSANCTVRGARGASWNSVPQWLSSARRFKNDFTYVSYSFLGFRLARTLP